MLGVVYSFVRWSLLLFGFFGLPYVASHIVIIKRAQALTKVGNRLSGAAFLSGMLFLPLSALCIFALRFIVPAHHAGGYLPLPWVPPSSPRAGLGIIIALMLFVPAALVLTVLNARQAGVILREEQSLASDVPKGRAIWRYPLHLYATLAGCALMMAYLFASQLGFAPDVEVAWLVFSLIVLIPYSAAHSLSHRLTRSFTQKTKRNGAL